MYYTQGQIADDQDMRIRVAQCAAQEGVTNEGIDPDLWTYEWRRVWSASPGWDAAWESALANPDKPEGYSPGADPACITDAQILSQVQGMTPFKRVADTTPTPPAR